jgi:branched-chain amino acid transport system substrate-binding protein
MKQVNHSPHSVSVLLACLITSALMTSALVASDTASAADVELFKVGITGPLTGPQAAIGKDDENGARMALDKANAQGIMTDGKQVRFELVSVDDAADPRTGMTVAQNLVDGNVRFSLGPYNSGVAIPTSRLLNDAGVLMATVATNPQITTQGLPNVFRIAASDSQIGARMGEYAFKTLKLRRMAIIDDRTAYGQGVAEEFAKAATANGIEIVDREFTSDKATDFAAVLTKVKSFHPDGLFYGGYYSQGGPLLKQMNRLAMNQYLLGGDAICNDELGKLAGNAVDDRTFCALGGPVLESTPAGKAFKSEYARRYNADPLTYSASMYDGMMLLAAAVKRAHSIDTLKVRAALLASDLHGVAGNYSFNDSHDLKDSPITVYTFKHSAMTPIAGAGR